MAPHDNPLGGCRTDIEAKDRADRVGLAFDRTASVNDDATVMQALAARIHAAAGR